MKMLVIAPHRDDEMIGVGGTILKRKAAGDHVTVCIVTARRGQELPPKAKIIHEEMLMAHEFCGVDELITMPFAAVELVDEPKKRLNKEFYDAILSAQPDEVYIPFWGDMHTDHSVVAEAAMVALRSKHNHAVRRIYAYETLSETGINYPVSEKAFIPNVFEDISLYLEKKKKALSFYKSQFGEFPNLRSLDAVEALAKYRGATVNVNAAEAFMLVREIK